MTIMIIIIITITNNFEEFCAATGAPCSRLFSQDLFYFRNACALTSVGAFENDWVSNWL